MVFVIIKKRMCRFLQLSDKGSVFMLSRKLLRRAICGLMLVLLLSTFTVPTLATEDIRVVVNGVEVEFTDAAPFVDENFRTMIPLRAVSNALGCEVTWNQTARTARIFKDHCISAGFGASSNYKDGTGFFWREDAVIALYLHTGIDQIFYELAYELHDDEEQVVIESGNGAGLFTIDSQPLAKDGRIYLPIRSIAESFGYTVAWDGETSTVVINADGVYMSSVNSDNSIYITAYPDWVGQAQDYQ